MAEITIKIFDTEPTEDGCKRCTIIAEGFPTDDIYIRELTEAEIYAYKIALFARQLAIEGGKPQPQFSQEVADKLEYRLRFIIPPTPEEQKEISETLKKELEKIREKRNAKLDNQSNCPG